jgi:hypothetical protein
VEVPYTDHMSTRVSVGDRSFEIEGARMDNLLALVDEAGVIASGYRAEV